MNIVLIGSGNAATVLGKLIKSAGHIIVQVISKQLKHAQILAAELQAVAITNIAEITKTAEIYIISVSDDSIEDIAKQLYLKDKIVVHTSGAVSKNILQNVSRHYGVLYPLQSLRKELTHIPDIPLVIDGNTSQTIHAIESFAGSFSENVHYADDTARLKLHVSAVFVSNFTNH